jgi:hypothetical protein
MGDPTSRSTLEEYVVMRAEICAKGEFELVVGGDDSLVITHLRADYRAGSLGMLQEKVRGKEIMLS